MTDIFAMPIDLDPQMKKNIQDAFTNALQEIGEYEYIYIENKIDTKTQIVAQISIPWVQRLSRYYFVLSQILEQNYPTATTISANAVKGIGAALFYFINPYDIIPDFTPNIGYADDYYILITCLEALGSRDRGVILAQLSSAKAEEVDVDN